MPANQFHCPSCQTLLRLGQPLPEGAKIKCPKCGTVFETEEAPPEAQPVPAKPPTPVGLADDHSYRPAPRYEEVPPRREAQNHEEDGRTGLAGLRVRPYSIDLGQWFHYASAHYTAVLWPMIGYQLLLPIMAFLLFVCGFFGIFIVLPPLAAGFAIVSLAQLKGKPWTFGDFFSGFHWFGSILGHALLMIPIVFGLVLLCVLPAAIMGGLAAAAKAPPLAILAAPLILAGLCMILYVLIRICAFPSQLIVDRNLGPIEAIKGSWALSRGHFWGLFGMGLLLVLINWAGNMLCGIGQFFTLPFTILVWNAGYLLVAGTKRPVEPQPYPHETDYRQLARDDSPEYR